MAARKADEGLDFEALRRGIERCEPGLIIGFYAEDAELRIVNAASPENPPFELRGKTEIAKHLRAVFGQRASHRVEREEVVGEGDGLKLREACEYQDGSRIMVETTLEVRGGKILRQVDVVARVGRTTKGRSNQKHPPEVPKRGPMQALIRLRPSDFSTPSGQPKRSISDDVPPIGGW